MNEYINLFRERFIGDIKATNVYLDDASVTGSITCKLLNMTCESGVRGSVVCDNLYSDLDSKLDFGIVKCNIYIGNIDNNFSQNASRVFAEVAEINTKCSYIDLTSIVSPLVVIDISSNITIKLNKKTRILVIIGCDNNVKIINPQFLHTLDIRDINIKLKHHNIKTLDVLRCNAKIAGYPKK